MTNLDEMGQSLKRLRSPKRSHTFWGLLAVLAVAAVLIWVKHENWLRAPNDFFLRDNPDGVKNYSTSAWHVRHDTTLVHYGGMNYPFGEHSLFTDNQPIVSATMQWWNRHVGYIGDRTVGLMNLFQVISLLLGCVALFLLFRKLHLPVWYGGLATLGIIFLSPQYLRFEGHFGLSHTFVIPGMLYLLCRYEERNSKRYQSLLIGILVWFSAQLHFYYFGLAALFLSLYMAFKVLRDFHWKNIRSRAAHWMVMVALPFAALNLWVHWADYAADRPASPYGFTSYIGFWEGVFLPYKYFPMHEWISKNILRIREVGGEAEAYAGAVAFFFTLMFVGRGLYRRVRNLFKIKPLHARQFFTGFKIFPSSWDDMAHHRMRKNYLRGTLTAAFLLLLFSCGFPFAIEGCGWMVDWMGPLRQFRGLARFTWAYYYVINVVAFYAIWNHSRRFPEHWSRWFYFVVSIAAFYLIWTYLHHGPRRWEQVFFLVAEAAALNFGLWWLARRFGWFSAEKLPEGSRRLAVLKNLIAVVPLGVLLWEAYFLQKNTMPPLAENLTVREKFVKTPPDHWLDKVDFSQFQALLPLPYYHVGSENLWLDMHYPLFINTQMTALQTGVPDMGVNMSRTSVGQTAKSVQMTLEPGEFPALLDELPDNRPLALFVAADRWEDVKTKYPHLVRKAKPVFENDKIRVLSLPLDSLRLAVREHVSEVGRDVLARAQYPAPGHWKSNVPDARIFYQSFDSLTNTKHVFQGEGAFAGTMSDTLWVHRGPLPKGQYALSFWTRAVQDNGMNHEVKIFEHNLADGHQIHLYHEGMRFYLKSIVGEWSHHELFFEVKNEGSRSSIFICKNNMNEPFFLDELVLRPRNTEIFRQEPGWVVRNNFWYRTGL